jgi:hypothetical protein
MPVRNNTEITLEGCRLVFKNFSGEPGPFNIAGDRNFCVILEHDKAEEMFHDGWNIKHLKPREEDDLPQPYIKVKVNYGGKGMPPRVILITEQGKTALTQDELKLADWATFDNVDLVFRAWNWSQPSGRGGVSAYLKAIYLTLQEDPLERKYRDVPDSARSILTMRSDFEPAGVIQASSEILAIERGGGDDRTPF